MYYMYNCALCACVVPKETIKGQLYALELESQVLMCGLGTEAGSPAWAASAPKQSHLSSSCTGIFN